MKQFEQFEEKVFSGFISEPEIKYFEKGSNKTTFAIPLKEVKTDEPLWLNCELWNRDVFAEEHRKGDFVTVIGRLVEEEYNGKTYVKFKVTNFI